MCGIHRLGEAPQIVDAGAGPPPPVKSLCSDWLVETFPPPPLVRLLPFISYFQTIAVISQRYKRKQLHLPDFTELF